MTVELEKIAGSFFISKGWKTFVHRTGLLSGQYIRFQVLTPSKINVLLFDKKKDSKLPMIPSSKKQIKTAPKRSTGITINDMPTSKHASMLISHTSNKETSSDSRTESMTDIPSSSDNSGETTRSFDDLCFCARNTAVTPDIKNYISIIGQFLQRSSKFYIVTMNNTFMKQDRLFQLQYFTKEYSVTYIQPLMGRKKTIFVQVEAAGSDSVTMLLHKSSDDRCNLKRGWATFAATNAIHLHSVCIFHFYKPPNVKITIDVL
ncbi:hypothetical protein OsJ_33502 [Oryza sativa Japonica Group]|uniref:TF-B3 domain-containing protein n=1 Tax=Oryza sativa subsp. japonica TaxID=39947 RepID=B9GA49_ORYSJ|nr:hypothetical protein OsJ_33502 [Oryza sativa Japonica Group]